MKKIKISLVLALLLTSQVFALDTLVVSSYSESIQAVTVPNASFLDNVSESIKAVFTPAPKEEQPRSNKWPKVRAEYLKTHNECAVCGAKKDLQVHHMIPFHVRPDLELNPANFITLCTGKSKGGLNCHLIIGHGGNFQDYNPDVAKDAVHFHDLLFNWQLPHETKTKTKTIQ